MYLLSPPNIMVSIFDFFIALAAVFLIPVVLNNTSSFEINAKLLTIRTKIVCLVLYFLVVLFLNSLAFPDIFKKIPSDITLGGRSLMLGMYIIILGGIVRIAISFDDRIYFKAGTNFNFEWSSGEQSQENLKQELKLKIGSKFRLKSDYVKTPTCLVTKIDKNNKTFDCVQLS